MSEKPRLYDIPAIVELNYVEGFDPSMYLRQSNDSADGHEDEYLDVKYRLLWFRVRHPLGKIAFVVHHLTEQTAVIEARIYTDKADPPENYVGSGLGRRTFEQSDPLGKFFVENAATAALGRALATAGFGSQFCDRSNEKDPDPVDTPVPSTPPGVATSPASAAAAVSEQETKPEATTPASMAPRSAASAAELPALHKADAAKTPASTPIEAAAPAKNYTTSSPVAEICAQMTVEEAKNMIVPFRKGDWAGKTFAWVAQNYPGQLAWLRDEYAGNDNTVRAAATVLINAAMQAA